MSEDSQPKLSVATIAYNAGKFIAQTMESVLMQKTNFPFEFVIAEDCSTDRTREIVRQYAALHPNVIRPLLNERNVGYHANFESVLKACRGEYVALLEGDDYWTSPLKLQKQTDFLNQHPDCVICFHRTRLLNAKTGTLGAELPVPPFRKEVQTVEALLRGGVFASTCSAVFRRRCLPPSLGKYRFCLALDWPLFLEIARHGKIGYIDDCMGVYRQHEQGVWSRLAHRKRLAAMAEFMEFMGHEFKGELAELALRNARGLRRAERRRRLLDGLRRHQHKGNGPAFWHTLAGGVMRDPGLLWYRPCLGTIANAIGRKKR
jgi:glycosyltransferase involved in cell wall biosynthesis